MTAPLCCKWLLLSMSRCRAGVAELEVQTWARCVMGMPLANPCEQQAAYTPLGSKFQDCHPLESPKGRQQAAEPSQHTDPSLPAFGSIPTKRTRQGPSFSCTALESVSSSTGLGCQGNSRHSMSFSTSTRPCRVITSPWESSTMSVGMPVIGEKQGLVPKC